MAFGIANVCVKNLGAVIWYCDRAFTKRVACVVSCSLRCLLRIDLGGAQSLPTRPLCVKPHSVLRSFLLRALFALTPVLPRARALVPMVATGSVSNPKMSHVRASLRAALRMASRLRCGCLDNRLAVSRGRPTTFSAPFRIAPSVAGARLSSSSARCRFSVQGYVRWSDPPASKVCATPQRSVRFVCACGTASSVFRRPCVRPSALICRFERSFRF